MKDLCMRTPEQKVVWKSRDLPESPGKEINNPLFNINFEDSDIEEDVNIIDVEVPTKPLFDTVIYVDVRAQNENRSKAISRELERMGATIADKIGGHVTHIVFKDGRQSTINQLKKYPHIQFVSVLWVDSCKTMNCKVNEGLYPGKYPDANDNSSLPFAKAKRVKSLQPKTFEEDINNSGKKEDRRRRRLKKLNKGYVDEVICLNSQEYIKSSDLYKLVATPLPIPDTPWIIDYINGSSEKTPDGPKGSKEITNDDLKHLSQDVQCKLTFDENSLQKSPSESCLIHLGSSPSETCKTTTTTTTTTTTNNRKESQQTIKKKKENKHPKNSSSESQLSSSPFNIRSSGGRQESQNNDIANPSDPKLLSLNENHPIKKVKNKMITNPTSDIVEYYDENQQNLSGETKIYTSNKPTTANGPRKENEKGVTCTINSANNCGENHGIISVDIPLNSCEENQGVISINPLNKTISVHKRKKKLLSQPRVPQEKLISPLQKETKEKGNTKNNKHVPLKMNKKKYTNASISQNYPQDIFTVLQQLENSKKSNEECVLNKSSLSSTSFLNKSQLNCGVKNSNRNKKLYETINETLSSIDLQTIPQKRNSDDDSKQSKGIKQKVELAKQTEEQIKDAWLYDGPNECSSPMKENNTKCKRKVESLKNTSKVKIKYFTAEPLQTKGVPTENLDNIKTPNRIHGENHCIEIDSGQEIIENKVIDVEERLLTTIQRRRSSRLNARRSSIDFKMSKKFRNATKAMSSSKQSYKIDIELPNREMNNVKQITDGGAENQEENIHIINHINAEEDTDDDNGDIDPNTSFVHDENEGLVCANQDGTVFKFNTSFKMVTDHEDEDATTSKARKETEDMNQAEELRNELIETTGVSIIFDSDSGISDSEDSIESINISKNTVKLQEERKKETTKNPKEKTKSSNKTRTVKSMRKSSSLTVRKECNTVKTSNSTKASLTSAKTLSKSKVSRKVKKSIVFTSLHFGEQDFAKSVVNQLGEFKLKNNVAMDTTHVVCGDVRRTLNILHGIIQGCWIVSPKWVSDSLEEGYWMDEEEYELDKEFPTAKISRINLERSGKSNCSRLFANLPRIYLAEVTSPTHEEMMRLITSCGGLLTNAIRKAGIAVGLVKTFKRTDLRIVSEKWILDSITNGRIMPTRTYEYRVPFTRDRSPDY